MCKYTNEPVYISMIDKMITGKAKSKYKSNIWELLGTVGSKESGLKPIVWCAKIGFKPNGTMKNGVIKIRFVKHPIK